MKRLLTTLVILTGLLGSGGAVWADALYDLYKGGAADGALVDHMKHTEEVAEQQWHILTR